MLSCATPLAFGGGTGAPFRFSSLQTAVRATSNNSRIFARSFDKSATTPASSSAWKLTPAPRDENSGPPTFFDADTLTTNAMIDILRVRVRFRESLSLFRMTITRQFWQAIPQ